MNAARWWLLAASLALSACGAETATSTAGKPAEITPASTMCGQFAAGAAPALLQVKYSLRANAISQVTPGAFNYWARLLPSSGGPDAVVVMQSTDAASRPLSAVSGGVFDNYNAATGACDAVSSTMTHPFGPVTLNFTATAGTTYYIVVRFSTTAVVPEVVPPSGTIKFFYSVAGVSTSASTVELVAAS
jgi:hypothetical protein